MVTPQFPLIARVIQEHENAHFKDEFLVVVRTIVASGVVRITAALLSSIVTGNHFDSDQQ